MPNQTTRAFTLNPLRAYIEWLEDIAYQDDRSYAESNLNISRFSSKEIQNVKVPSPQFKEPLTLDRIWNACVRCIVGSEYDVPSSRRYKHTYNNNFIYIHHVPLGPSSSNNASSNGSKEDNWAIIAFVLFILVFVLFYLASLPMGYAFDAAFNATLNTSVVIFEFLSKGLGKVIGSIFGFFHGIYATLSGKPMWPSISTGQTIGAEIGKKIGTWGGFILGLIPAAVISSAAALAAGSLLFTTMTLAGTAKIVRFTLPALNPLNWVSALRDITSYFINEITSVYNYVNNTYQQEQIDYAQSIEHIPTAEIVNVYANQASGASGIENKTIYNEKRSPTMTAQANAAAENNSHLFKEEIPASSLLISLLIKMHQIRQGFKY